MNDCARVKQLQAERAELLATIADTSACAERLESALVDAIAVLEQFPPETFFRHRDLIPTLKAVIEDQSNEQ